jgi:tetratricopeptide (TPR) repeat protein
MKKSLSKRSSNDLILEGKYDEAIALLRKELKQLPHAHWDLTQLSSAYYEKRKYKLARRYAEKSLSLKPNCPNTMWHYAGVIVLFDIQKAYEVYRKLLKKGIGGLDRMACCNEGHERNLGLLNDCRFRLGLCCNLLNKHKEANRWLRLFVNLHNSECIHHKKDAQELLEKNNAWKVK